MTRPATSGTVTRARRYRRPGRLAAATIAVVCLVAAGGWLALPGWQARDHLLAAAGLARQLQEHLASGRVPEARRTLLLLQRQTGAARARTTALGWRVARRVPGLGADVTAVGAVAAVMDDLARDGLPALVEITGDLDPATLAPRDGRIDLAPLRRAAPRIATADAAVRQARDRIAAIDTGPLVPPLREAVTELRRDLDRAAAGTATAVRAAELVPSLLGTERPRTHLVLFQNPAELRATGGMPGAFAVVRADRGTLRLIHQGTAGADLKSFESPVLPLDPALRDLYTDRLGTYPANINLTPHFPTAAALAREMYRLRTGRTVDGVLATDPIALSYLLGATGPVKVAGGPPLTAGNAVRLLLSEVYARAGSTYTQDRYFAAAAAAVFDAAVGGAAEPRAALTALARAAGERRLLVWSADPREQRLIAGTVLAGELPTDDALTPTVGVFLNDGSGAKLGFYLTQAAHLSAAGCRSDGRRVLRLRVTLGSTAPRAGLPRYVLGLGLAGDPYTARTNVSIFSPAGGALVDVRLDGAPVPVGAGIERGRAVGILPVDVAPGASRTLEATLLTAAVPLASTTAPRLWLTPAVTPWRQNSTSETICAVNR